MILVKIPKLQLPRDRQYVARLMAPFNMRCKTCGEYIYKGKKFNARKETVQNESYLGLPIFWFYNKCTCCLAEITFKTDPENTDYAMQHGATRNFQAQKLLEEEEKRLQKERKDEELNNPMKVLENRTKDSKLEMEVLENLQELNQRQAHVDFESMLLQHQANEEQQRPWALEEDERETKAMLEQGQSRKLLQDFDSDEDSPPGPAKWFAKAKPADIPREDSEPQAKKMKVESRERSVGKLSDKAKLSGLVTAKRKPDLSVANGADSWNMPPGPGAGSADKTSVDTSLASRSKAGASSLSLLGAYSDSEDSKSD
ncbi:splicing factor YJU2-like [Rhineura floridana]|uniref:splicing factor YJU2-like n=1 Tax=Rhineura floridana TaxID=261503 RepID=UPI002AC8347A|nr:splicing factor YJU2-like [Rhineura floridana]